MGVIDGRFGIKLLSKEAAADSELSATAIAELLGLDVTEVERVMDSHPGEVAMTAPTREEAERMQDAFSTGGITTGIIALGRVSERPGDPVRAQTGREAVAQQEAGGQDGPAAVGAQVSQGNPPSTKVGPVGRWIAEADQARGSVSAGEPGGYTITIPPLNREQRITVAAAGVTVLGLFAPIIRGPLGMRFSYFDGAGFTALLLLLGCLAVAGLVATRRTPLAVLPLAGVAGLIGYRFLRLSWDVIRIEGDIQAMQQDDIFGFSEALFGDIGLGWGWVLLLLGVGAMIYGVAISLRKES